MLYYTDKFKGFKLISLELINHKILGTNTFNFVDYNDNPESIYFSVIIGSNGTGKSELLKLILLLFRNICLQDINQRFFNIDGLSKFKLVYFNNGVVYTFSNFPKNYEPTKENFSTPIKYIKPYLMEEIKDGRIKEKSFNNARKTLPISIVANSIMLTDKFIVPRNEKEQSLFPMYKYLGVRNRPQQASTRSYTRKTIEFIVEQVDSLAFTNGMEKLTEFLGLKNSIIVTFNTAYTTHFYTPDIKKSDLDDYFGDIEEQYKKSETIAPFKLNYYNSIKKEKGLIESLCEFIRTLIREERLNHIDRSSVKKIIYDVIKNDSHGRLKKEFKYLEHLRLLGLIRSPEVLISTKNEGSVYLEESSSGEFHLFSTMVSLMATMKSNSLIIIDEPEISLHPNWQMKYIEFLRELFSNKEYQTCQIIIATHSHFIISDLKGNSSNILGLRKSNKNEKKIETVELAKNTYGWSAEDVLYNIFDVSTTRNFYIAREIGEILKKISKKDYSANTLKNKESKLSQIKEGLKENDPLKSLITKIQEEISNA